MKRGIQICCFRFMYPRSMYDFAQNRVKKLFLQLLRVRWRAIYDFPTLEYRPPMTFVVVRGRREQSQQGQGLETKHFEFSIFVWSRQVQLYFSRAVNYWRSSDNCPLPDEVLHAIGHGAARTSVLRLQQCQVMSAVTVIWASTLFGHPHSQNPCDKGIPCNPNPNR